MDLRKLFSIDLYDYIFYLLSLFSITTCDGFTNFFQSAMKLPLILIVIGNF